MKTTRVCSFWIALFAFHAAATQASAQFRPAQMRASESAQWSQADCFAINTAEYSTGGDFYSARKGPAHAFITYARPRGAACRRGSQDVQGSCCGRNSARDC